MSKRGFISRYLLILKKLKAKPYSSYEEIQSYMESQIVYLQLRDDGLNVQFSLRTLQRDIREIRNLFGIDIEHSKGRKGYHILQSEMENMNFQRMLEYRAGDFFLCSFGTASPGGDRKSLWYYAFGENAFRIKFQLSEILG
ncbi:hypothetical protein [Mucilaginibacter sp.]